MLFFLEPPLEKDRGVRWINSVKVLLSFFSFSLPFLFLLLRRVLQSRVAESRIR